MADLPFGSATNIAKAIHRRQLSCREVLDVYLDRIGRFNADINAVVTLDYDGAIARAEQADARTMSDNPLGPLHGVPITIKDAFATAGIRTTAGLSEIDHVPTRNAAAVQRLVDAGAVVIGKTNCPPGVTGQETANTLFGRTNNPWDLSRTSGASSGGAAAALAAGLTALELGSDSGGSIRQPASYCGVYGHFPTQGLVPARGHLPQVGLDEIDVHVDLMSVGPLARDAADLALALDVLAGPDTWGKRAWNLQLPAPAVAPERCTVGVWLDDDDYPVDAAVTTVLERAAGALRDSGMRVVDARPSFSLVDAERTAFALWVSSSIDRNDDELDAELRRRAGRFGSDDDSRAARRARAATMSHREWLRLDDHRRRLQRQWEQLFTTVDVLLCPVTPVPAFAHDPDPDLVADIDHRIAQTIDVNGSPRPYLDQLVWTTVVGMARLPSTVAPAGLTAEGLPVGVQIVGPALADRLTIAFAQHLAEVVGGFVAPPRFA